MKPLLTAFTDKPEKLFVIITAVFGSIAIALAPILTAPDEGAHFWVSYGMFSENEQIPTDLLVSPQDSVKAASSGNYFSTFFTEKAQTDGFGFNISKNVYINEEHASRTTSSFDITHLAQAIGILLGKLIYPSIGVMVTLGRVANLVVYIAAIYFIIKKVRYGKLAFTFLALFPILIQQAGSLSYDVINVIVVFAWMALMINLFTQRTRITRPQSLLMAALTVALVFTKLSNAILLVFLPFVLFNKTLLPRKSLRVPLSKRTSLTIACLFGAAVIIIGLVVLDIVLSSKGIGSWQFAKVLFNTFFRPEVNTQLDPIITSGIVGNFGWLWYRLPEWLVFIHLGVLGVVLLGEKTPNISKRFAIVSTTAFVLSVLGITMAMYLLWTLEPSVVGPSANFIQGMQGRYFTPLLILLLPGFAYLQKFLRVVVSHKTLTMMVAAMAIVSLVTYLVLTYIFFYTPANGVKDILLS